MQDFIGDFIKNFSKIARPLCRLLEKYVKFEFNDECKSTFEEIKARLVIAQSWQHHTGVRILKLCVMLVIMQWEEFWGK